MGTPDVIFTRPRDLSVSAPRCVQCNLETGRDRESELGSREMNPPCARCKKTVYPVEKLSCLDKVGMALLALCGPQYCVCKSSFAWVWWCWRIVLLFDTEISTSVTREYMPRMIVMNR